MLGRQPDRKIAELTGRTVKNVRHKRLKLGIPFFNPEFRPWTRAEDKLLGTDFDRVIGERLGRHWATISQRRRGLGIPAFGRVRAD